MFDAARRLAGGAIARPGRAIVLMHVLALLAAPGLLRLELRTDGNALFAADDPVVRFDAEVRRHFQLDDVIVVYLASDHPAGIYNPETLHKVQELTDALSALPGVRPQGVMSLATENRDRVYPGTLRFRPFLDPLPETPEQLATLRSDVDAASILTGTLVSADRGATAILVGVLPSSLEDPLDRLDRAAFYRRIETLVAPFSSGEETVRVVGAPAAESLLGFHLMADMVTIMPLCLLLIALVIGVGCGRFWGPVIGFMEVGAALVFTFGVMGWLEIPVYLTTPVLLVVLTTIGLADEIHILWHYQRLAESRAPAGEPAPGDDPSVRLAEQTMDAMTRPLVLTSLTTAIGFLSFLASPLPPVRSFGLFAALGIAFCMLWSLTVVPALLVRLGPAKLARPRPVRGEGWSTRLIAPLLRRPRATLAMLAAISAIAAWGLTGIEVQDGWVDGFDPQSPFRQATDRVNDELFGTHILLAHLDFRGAGEKEPLAQPERLEAIGAFEDFARGRPGVGGVLGTYSHLTAVAYLWLGRKEEARAIPATPFLVRRLIQRFDDGRGVLRRRQILDDALERTVVTLFLENANYRETRALETALRDYAEEHLAPLGGALGFAGDVAVSQAMIPKIVGSQVRSLVLAVLGALIGLCLIYRSLRLGLYAVLPVAIAVLWVFGLMGWAKIPLGVATSMFCAITLGVGVDYAIHYLERFRRARAAGQDAPVRVALAEAGPAIATDVLAVGLGFGLLIVSQAPSNARLGILVALALGSSALCTLAGLGAVLTARDGA